MCDVRHRALTYCTNDEHEYLFGGSGRSDRVVATVFLGWLFDVIQEFYAMSYNTTKAIAKACSIFITIHGIVRRAPPQNFTL